VRGVSLRSTDLFPVPCSLFPQDPTERTCVPCSRSLSPYGKTHRWKTCVFRECARRLWVCKFDFAGPNFWALLKFSTSISAWGRKITDFAECAATDRARFCDKISIWRKVSSKDCFPYEFPISSTDLRRPCDRPERLRSRRR